MRGGANVLLCGGCCCQLLTLVLVLVNLMATGSIELGKNNAKAFKEEPGNYFDLLASNGVNK
jgi:hypothetical protein